MARMSIKEVASRAGVSVGTVSNVLNHRGVVAKATRAKVLAAIEELGFVRNESARQLRAGRSRTIGLVVLDVGNPFFTDVAAGVEALADEVGSIVSLHNSGESVERERHQLEVLLEQRVQGVLITPVDERATDLAPFVDRGIPVVLVDRAAGAHGLCSVGVDDVLGGRLAAEHVASLGHEQVVFVGGPDTLPQVADRLHGARQGLRAAGVDRPLGVFATKGLRVAEGQHAARELLTLGSRPTAIVCANDLLALGVLRELVRQRLHVPQDLAIVGYDDIDFAGAASIPLTSVRQPRAELGRAALQLLLDELTEGERHRHRQVRFSPSLVVRESTAGASTAAPSPVAEPV